MILEIFEKFSYLLGPSILLLFLTITVLFLTWLERKTLAKIQMRMGPMFVGFHGALQPIADAVKLALKEDIIPRWSNKQIYWFAPIAVFVPAFMIWVTLPISDGFVVRNLELGLFYIVSISVLSVLGMVLAGWSSANKYAFLGGVRAAGQLISYEIPFIMAILSIAMISKSLNLVTIVENQSSFPNIIVQPIGALIFFLSGLAEIGRTPFDIHHAESEVAGGPFIEYSGAHWSVFFLAEYINTFTVAALVVLLYFGGWNWPKMPFDGNLHSFLSILLFLLKCYLIVLLIFWIRGTSPRLRIDQLMSFCWKLLAPLSFINIIITGFILYYKLPWIILSLSSVLLLIIALYIIRRKTNAGPQNTIKLYSTKELRASNENQ